MLVSQDKTHRGANKRMRKWLVEPSSMPGKISGAGSGMHWKVGLLLKDVHAAHPKSSERHPSCNSTSTLVQERSCDRTSKVKMSDSFRRLGLLKRGSSRRRGGWGRSLVLLDANRFFMNVAYLLRSAGVEGQD